MMPAILNEYHQRLHCRWQAGRWLARLTWHAPSIKRDEGCANCAPVKANEVGSGGNLSTSSPVVVLHQVLQQMAHGK
jgi:hypothetical protein